MTPKDYVRSYERFLTTLAEEGMGATEDRALLFVAWRLEEQLIELTELIQVIGGQS